MTRLSLRGGMSYQLLPLFFIALLGACSFSSAEISTSPPWPTAGPKVAEELSRVPFAGWPVLETLRRQIPDLRTQYGCPPASEDPLNPNWAPCSNELLNRYLDDLERELTDLAPGSGFEDFWEWMARLDKLMRQLEVDRG